MEYSMVIDGQSVTTGQWDDVINPAKGEPFAQCPRGTPANVEDAVQAAARAFAAAPSCTTPSCIQTAFAPTAIAASTTGGTSSERRNTSTTSIGPGAASSVGQQRSPSTCSTSGFTGMIV